MPKWQIGRLTYVNSRHYRVQHFTKEILKHLISENFRGWISDSRHNLWFRRLKRDEYAVWVAKIKTAKGIRRFVLGPVYILAPRDARALVRQYEYWYEDPAQFNKKERRWADEEDHGSSTYWLPPQGEICPRCNNKGGNQIVPNQYKTNGWGCLRCYYKFRFERLANFKIWANQARVLCLRETIKETRKTGI